MEYDKVISGHGIIIKNKTIDYVGILSDNMYPRNSKIIDGQGKYVIPGLSDMHMHIDHPDVLKVNLAYGVTTVMNYRGIPEHLALRDASSRNEIFSPNIYSTGDYMEGYPATMPGYLSFNNVDDARKSVQNQKEKGYDFIKVYRNLDTLMHKAICEEASKNNLTVVGHLSPNISLQQSLEAGQKVIAHTEELMYYFNNENDTTRIDDLINLLKKHNITYTPNLAIFKSLPLQVQKIDSITSQDYIKYLQPAIFQPWRKEFNYNYSRGKAWAKFMWERFVFLQKVTKKINEAGIPVLTSTDAPTSGSFPGLAVHQELKEFVSIGFTPYEALKTATVAPGKFINESLNNSEKFGLIKKGYRADLLILDKNPIENIENTQTIFGVIKYGEYYSKSTMQNVLDTLEAVYKDITPIVKSIEEEIANGDVEKAYEIFKQGRSKYNDQSFLGFYTMWYRGYRFLYQNRRLTENMDQAEKAVQFYKMYQEQFPEFHGSYYILGVAYSAKKDTVNAINSFRKSLELHPHNPYVSNRLEQLKAVK
ncbi:amidohydrolase family protein [Croceitalea rosinachiae]|uniref:Amidohydrolase family protein n=1 Tax=Croceitalea rosinachiae TaxID=3075596 RepID=A0ABU3A898_9FLAO|nr:amidohydrolase family protein [Croceitalea sp. F388]MDT0606020.1 amidohydrolase family protein [Croceitalea sp. F388]